MKEYREAKKRGKNGSSVKFSTFSPLKALSSDDTKYFMYYYDKILLFSYHYRTNGELIVADDLMTFLSAEREYFYENKEPILEAFIKEHPPTTEEEALIEAIRESQFDAFILLEYGRNTAVISDTSGNSYNVQALTTPFNKIFSKKPLMMYTALIPYKNRYILDGRYAVIQEKMTKEVKKEIANIPTLGRETQYQKEKSIITFPVSINLTVFCDAVHFEKMENIILKNIPHNFTQKMLNQFKDTPFERVSFTSSFIRTMDYLNDINGDDIKEMHLLNGLSISNDEVNGESSIIPYEILEKYYQQKDLNQSISKGIYKNVQDAKEIVKEGRENILQASSFYSMIGVFYIHDYDIDEFSFLEYLNSLESRKAFSQEIEALFETLNADIDFDMTPVYLDFTLELDDIIDEIDAFRDYMRGLFVRHNFKKIIEYSQYKDRKPKLKLFS
ncbi:hypothetical protein MNB_SV-13-1418 [hydrothermal vent metagenome]|uniref:Uncharacterized protein n=1 Tax=hydrothermal vent metagenome TaxID=652676 RepID=A0A1W1D048_9ZZZZ